MRNRAQPSTVTAITALCFALVLAFVSDAGAAVYTWDGNGDANNGGNWSNADNWDHGTEIPDDATDTADFTASLSAPRYITNDVATTVDTIVIVDGGNQYSRHHLVLGSNLTVDAIDGGHDKYYSHIHVNGYTFTVGQSIGPGGYMPGFDGGGTIVKASPNTVTLQGADTFDGSIIVSNGVLNFRSSAWDTTTLMTVIDGATAAHISEGADLPTNIVINGQGYNSGGALRFSLLDACGSHITLGSDSKIKQSSGTTTLSGNISGTDVLTLEGGSGDFQIASASAAFSGKLVITNTSVLMQGSMPNVTNIWIDAGGVLEGLASQFPSATVVETNGGVWITPTSAEWTGNGDGSNWTDTANWAPQVVPTNVATIPLPGSPRTVVVDAPTNVYQLAMAEGANNVLLLKADLTVDLVDHPSDDGYPGAKIRLNGNTLTVRSGSATYFPVLNDDVGGSLVKIGPGTVQLITEDNFTGSMIVSNGILDFYGGNWDVCAGLTVNDGTTAHLDEPGPELPTNVTISGQGYNGAGAIEFAGNDDECSSDITLVSDSKMKRLGTQTTTLAGDIAGTNVLTLEGPGTFDLTASSYSFSGTLWITNGTVSVPGTLTSVTNIIVRNGGVLVGTITHFPSVVDGGVTNITVEPGGEWQADSVATWTGNGNPDNGGNWSDPDNWSGGEVPTYKAILGNPSVNRSVTNDVASSVDVLQMEEAGNSRNRLVVMAPISIGTYDPQTLSAGYFNQVDNYSTMTISNHNSNYCFDMDKGDGTYVIDGAGRTIVAQASGTFSGDVILSNGTLHVRSANARAWSGITVKDGTTVYFSSPAGWRSSPVITINGSGNGTYGALYHAWVTVQYSNLVVASDATLQNTVTMTFDGGEISGPGDLTKTGAGTMNIDNTYNFAIEGADGNSLVISDGTVDISDATLSVSLGGGTSAKEYVVIDYSGEGTLEGEFAEVIGLKSGYELVYDGTDDNPDCVVLIAGPKGSLLLLR